VQNDLGVINNGLVYGLYDFEPSNSSDDTKYNELTFKDGDQLRILRRGDEHESEWWWARHETNQQEGYVPRNYLGTLVFSPKDSPSILHKIDTTIFSVES
ncbi:unnamed protein product, partial [Rotaria magnacalcarata]